MDFSEVSAEEMIEVGAESFLKEYEKISRLMRRIVRQIV